jgi:hypothetical protein
MNQKRNDLNINFRVSADFSAAFVSKIYFPEQRPTTTALAVTKLHASRSRKDFSSSHLTCSADASLRYIVASFAMLRVLDCLHTPWHHWLLSSCRNWLVVFKLWGTTVRIYLTRNTPPGSEMTNSCFSYNAIAAFLENAA